MSYTTYNRIVVGVEVSKLIEKKVETRTIELHDKYTGEKTGETETITDVSFQKKFGDKKIIKLDDISVEYGSNHRLDNFYENLHRELGVEDTEMLCSVFYDNDTKIEDMMQILIVGDKHGIKVNSHKCYVGVQLINLSTNYNDDMHNNYREIPMEDLTSAIEDVKKFFEHKYGLYVNPSVVYDVAPSY